MSGLIGFTKNSQFNNKEHEIVNRMSELITHKKFYKPDQIFLDNHISGTRVHTNVIQKDPQPFHESGIYVWLDGEFYNQEELCKEISAEADNDLSLLLQLYVKNTDFSFLKRIDGIYSAIIYDTHKNQVHLISDRYGFRYLYWTIFSDSLFWSSELKAMLAIPQYVPVINNKSLDQFLSIGYILENNTWFEDISLLPSGSVLTWDLSDKSYTIFRYWGWDDIQPREDIESEEVLIDNLGDLFIKSVQRRCGKNENIGIYLSGGLDSRAILAAIPDYVRPIHAITFGKKECDDANYAKLAADLKKAEHHFFELETKNWLGPRFQGIWWTDGQFDLMHMHGIEFLDSVKHLFDINLNGFAGDLIIGGSYLEKEYFDTPLDRQLLVKKFGDFDINFDDYEYLKKTDFFFIQNRVRRFTYGGIKHGSVSIEQRKPFFDNELIDFIYSLPDNYRYEHNIYNKMLLKKFPQFFEKIPWQNTGYPIGSSKFYQKMINTKNSICMIFSFLFRKFGINILSNKEYTDYPDWIRHDPAKSIISKILGNEDAIYQKYLSKENVMKELNEHMEGKDHSSMLCRCLTFEIWLQQVYNGKYREDYENCQQ